MANLNKKETLTLELLRKEVPIFHAGLEAQEELLTTTADEKIQELRKIIREGEEAQERLIKSSLSFIMTLAKKEQARRAQWGSVIPLDDIIQEGMAGLIRGFRAYNPHASQKSATNYLGQWVTSQMRRGLESMDHSFTVPHESMERQRKIRAIRSRLENELGRKPTDEEIVQAAQESKGQYGDKKMGRVKKITSQSNARDITLDHVEEERILSTRTGNVLPTERTFNDDENPTDTMDISGSESISTDSRTTTTDDIVDRAGQASLSRLLEQTINDIRMPETQRIIIQMKFGLPPYTEEHTLKNIISETKAPKHRIRQVIDAFSQELRTPQGTFHKHTQTIQEDLHSIGIGWVSAVLGEYDPHKPTVRPQKALTEPLQRPKTRQRPTMPSGVSEALQSENKHTYECSIHGFFDLFIEDTPNETTRCIFGSCQQTANLID